MLYRCFVNDDDGFNNVVFSFCSFLFRFCLHKNRIESSTALNSFSLFHVVFYFSFFHFFALVYLSFLLFLICYTTLFLFCLYYFSMIFISLLAAIFYTLEPISHNRSTIPQEAAQKQTANIFFYLG